ncbi:PREDICTED: F-box/kelch-repeat protein At1g57790-like [Fragaria vesca subsp. vesca]|uniref:F-box/kelch-repeat protein At1g57790-like n=1 Tax=Fragaria vesca subsp. vesca TaxID=101020 RepID=UPI0002C32178|nr:PREDICTED: F-box/kelch-repeat protein At1g57790-like [Fragaria vesca subsp. vesca]
MTTSETEEERPGDEKKSCWSDIPVDILCEVADRVPYWDLFRFATVCKTWRLAIYRVHLPQRSTLLVPYLLSYTCIRERDEYIEFYDLHGETYKYPIDSERQLFGGTSRLYARKFGWLLLKKLELPFEQFYLFNPFWNLVVLLPPLELELGFQVVLATFTSSPIRGCVILVIARRYGSNDHIINTCKLPKFDWSVHKTRCQGSVEGVAYLDGIFYCVVPKIIDDLNSLSLSISTFNIALQAWVMDYASTTLQHHTRSSAFCVVESDGKLLLAVRDEPVLLIYQFDWLRKDWIRVQNLGNHVLLLDHSSSIACPTLGRDSKFSNKIFHLDWGKEPFTFSGNGVWRRP